MSQPEQELRNRILQNVNARRPGMLRPPVAGAFDPAQQEDKNNPVIFFHMAPVGFPLRTIVKGLKTETLYMLQQFVTEELGHRQDAKR